VSELCLDGAQIVSGGPHVFGDGAAEIVDAEIGANSGFALEGVPLLGEARVGTGLGAGAVRAEEVDHGRVAVRMTREGFEDGGDFGAYGQRLMNVALGVEADGAEMGIVIGGRDAGRGAVTETEIGAEQQKETERGTGGFEELTAFLIGGDGGAGLGLMDAGDGVAERGGSGGDAFEPVDEAAQALGVSGARVLGEARAPGGDDAMDAIGGELRRHQAAVIGD